ncbi:putative FY-rich, FY-rich, WD40/YVTN repeat-like-containing domain protein [Tanacetum coccineum]
MGVVRDVCVDGGGGGAALWCGGGFRLTFIGWVLVVVAVARGDGGGMLEVKISCDEGKKRHSYPVGYVAHRNNNGNTYKMTIIEGLKGPEFVISSTDGQSCSGQTPDIAWEGFQKKGCVRIKFWQGNIFMQDRWLHYGGVLVRGLATEYKDFDYVNTEREENRVCKLPFTIDLMGLGFKDEDVNGLYYRESTNTLTDG